MIKTQFLTKQQSGPTTTSPRKTGVLVGVLFLAATFTFAIGNALIRSYFSSATAHIDSKLLCR